MELFCAAIFLPIVGLLAMALVPSRVANHHAVAVRQLVTGLACAATLTALMLATVFWADGLQPRSLKLFGGGREAGGDITFYYDGATSVMLLLVTFVGFVASRFSIRYLDGEITQGQYFRWLSFTMGAVSLMVVAGDLLLFFLAWVMTSFGLHHLLLHYRDRPAAQRAAWTKFAISRLGDAFLISALVLTYKTFGTLDLAALFAALRDSATASQGTATHAAIGWLLVLGAVTKSAQFPFHTWLPDTMETPTPVSALMHAGIVNAGGYLIIRMSPLVALAPSALTALAVIGAFTACFAGVVMMTQSSVKRTLAYSTIAQMGFMMLQCGLGAFSAAMLHILAHSLYKAHAFLSSGSVVSQSLAIRGAKSPAVGWSANVAYLIGAGAATISAYFAFTLGFGLDVAAKPGGLVLAFILCLALTTWGWRLLTLGQARTSLVGLIGVVGLCLTYVVSYLAIDHLLAATVPAIPTSPADQLILLDVALAFSILFALHMAVMQRLRPGWLEPLQVHAASGFYVDAIYHRIYASLAKS